ncbi:ATP-grasp domain-containing protein [Bacillus sp. B190/17]|uniref:ATP-grasp domain-containing protein n=1 Tax=Bacillus lumedeiriae TaxID=3058829 RepID=A0ABW8I548_9BACI
MKAIIFVDSNQSGSSWEGIKAAKKLGYFVHLLTDRVSFLKNSEGFSEIDQIHAVDLEEKENIQEAIINIQCVHHVVCIISFIDSYIQMAAEFSNRFCGTNISTESIKRMENKSLTRTYLKDKEYSPSYFIVQKNESMKHCILRLKGKYPLVVKLPRSTGSKDVFFIKTEYELRNRMKYLRERYPEEDILIEEYLEGPQFIVEAIVYDGNVQIAAVVKQEITRKERFIVTGYSLSSELDREVYHTLIETSLEIIKDLDIKNGNCHLELRLTDERWKLIEANPRISGGVINRLIEEAYGFNYAQQIINVYSGNQPLLIREDEMCVYAHYMTVGSLGTLLKVTGMTEAMSEKGVAEVYIKPRNGQTLTPPLSMGHRYGYVLAKGTTEKEAQEIALRAANYIQFHLDPI